MFYTDETQFFEGILFETIGSDTEVDTFQFLGGGCINNAVKLETAQGTFFLKWSEDATPEIFESEAKGLELLRSTHTVRVPAVLSYGARGGKSYLLLEYLSERPPVRGYWEDLGTRVAALHRHTHTHFGLSFNNYIGSLEQSNDFYKDWTDFFIDRRLKVQSGLAYYNGIAGKSLLTKLEKLYKKLPDLLPRAAPSLLHGDLWSGNVISGNNGKAWLIDPAVYYGNREAEMAFTRLFGGFDDDFYEGYQEAHPLESGFGDRVGLYNLYPLLVHANLFGATYITAVENVLKRFI